MDSACAGRDYLSVKRTGYKGMPAPYEKRISGARPMSGKRSVAAKSSVPARRTEAKPAVPAKSTVPAARGASAKSSPVRVDVKDTYRVTAKTPVRAKTAGSIAPSRKEEKAKGYVYVEHCGIAGTLRDAFCTKRVKTKEKSCFDKIVLTFMFAVLMFFVAGSYCEYYDEFKSTNEIRSGISECREEQAKLLVAIEERNNRLGVEEYAVNTLGMVKSDKLTIHYVNISEQDVVSIKTTEENEAVTNGVLLSGFKSVMSNFTAKN